MKTEISRDSHQPEKRYSGVYHQQGRMLTDSDWNELMDILKERLDDALVDVVGSGTPRGRRLEVTGPDTFKSGHIYVDGIHGYVLGNEDGEFDYNDQKDFPNTPALLYENYILYADVWERTVTSLEDARLKDPALHGADTTSRTQTMVQIKCCPAGKDPEDKTYNPQKGNAELVLEHRMTSESKDPCDPCGRETSVRTGSGDYLFRVEVHDVKAVDGTTQVTLKWSSENGAEQYSLLDGHGLPDSFTAGKWVYEEFSDYSEKYLGNHLGEGFIPFRLDLKDNLNIFENYKTLLPSYIRRWDGYCILVRDGDGKWSLAEDDETALARGKDLGVQLSTESGAEELGTVSFSKEGNGLLYFKANLSSMVMKLYLTVKVNAEENENHVAATFMPGDYWIAEVREEEFKRCFEKKETYSVLESSGPHGITHHYLTLAEIENRELKKNYTKTDRKYNFPPLTEMTRMFIAGGDGQSAMPGHQLSSELQVGVANGQWPVEGAMIGFTVHGGGSISNVNGDKIGVTNSTGIFSCTWMVGSVSEGVQKVVAKLLDPKSDPSAGTIIETEHPPIVFTANLNTADNVQYVPGGCTPLNEVRNVQDAINELCKMDRGDGCAVTVNPEDELSTVLNRFIEEEKESINICLKPGVHKISGMDITGKQSIKITGAGASACKVILNGELTLEATTIIIRDVSIWAASERRIILNATNYGEIDVSGCRFLRVASHDNNSAFVSINKHDNKKEISYKLTWQNNSMLAMKMRKPPESQAPSRSVNAAVLEVSNTLKESLDVISEAVLRGPLTEEKRIKLARKASSGLKRLASTFKTMQSRKRRSVINNLKDLSTVHPVMTDAVIRIMENNLGITLDSNEPFSDLLEQVINGEIKDDQAISDVLALAIKLCSLDEALKIPVGVGSAGLVGNNLIIGYIVFADSAVRFGGSFTLTDNIVSAAYSELFQPSKQTIINNLGHDGAKSYKAALRTVTKSSAATEISSGNEIKIGFQNLTISNNSFHESNSIFVGDMVLVSGNQFMSFKADTEAAALALGQKGIFVGNMSQNKKATIYRAFNEFQACANLIEIT